MKMNSAEYMATLINLCRKIAAYSECRRIASGESNGVGEEYWHHELHDAIADLEKYIETYNW